MILKQKAFKETLKLFLIRICHISHLSIKERGGGGGMRMYAFNKLANSSCDYHDDLFFKNSL